MYIAIKNLLEEPQNNLKIFKVSSVAHKPICTEYQKQTPVIR